MALLLRKACEPVLSDFDLDGFHADMDMHKRLRLFTPCGKPFATVHGVRFSRIHPTQVEIDYATELLADWCTKNEKLISMYLEAFEVVQRLPEPREQLYIKDRAGDWKSVIASSYRERVLQLETTDKSLGKVTMLLRIDHTIKSVKFENETVSLPVTIKIPEKVADQIKQQVREYIEHEEATDKAEMLLTTLNSCKT